MPHTCFWDLNKLLTGINMKFLEKFRKDVSKEDGINLDIIDPTFFIPGNSGTVAQSRNTHRLCGDISLSGCP